MQTYAPDPAQATIHESWAYDVTDIREVIRNADAVVVAEVTSIDAMGTFEFAEGGLPMTGVSVAVREVLRGNVLRGDAPRQVTIYVLGGTVTLQQVFESQPRESSEKSGIADMDETERRSTTVEYVPQGPVRLEVGHEYVFMISDPLGDEIYAVSAGGYGIFEATTDGYTNHLTGNAFTHDEFVVMTAS